MHDLFGFLFARPSFREGMSRILDFGNTLSEYNSSLTPEQADALALRADWMTVAGDVRGAFEQIDVIAHRNRRKRAVHARRRRSRALAHA